VLGHVAGVLRLDPIGADADGRLAVALTTAPRDGDDAGVGYVTRLLAARVPFGESLRIRAPGMPGAPADLDPAAVAGATLVARHEQRLCGALIVAHDYGFRPAQPR
jgi:hypothetical protein